MTEEEPLSREARLRRVAKLCVHFARNMAYYRAARDNGERITPKSHYWNTVDTNFIDTAVLEWCKVFADRNGHQSWRRVVQDPANFEAELLRAVEKTSEQFEAVIEPIRVYRDKFLAHLDSKRVMQIPHLDPMWEAVRFCFRYVLDNEMNSDEVVRVGLNNLDDYYRDCFEEARGVYTRTANANANDEQHGTSQHTIPTGIIVITLAALVAVAAFLCFVRW